MHGDHDAPPLSIRSGGAGRALSIGRDGRTFVGRGYHVYSTADEGATWRLEARLPPSRRSRIGSIARLAARLLRFEIRALGVLESGNLVIGSREGVHVRARGGDLATPARVDCGARAASPPLSISVGPDDRVIWGEYDAATRHGNSVRIFASDDGGARFEPVHVFAPGVVLHVHSLMFDPRLEQYWVFTGDFDDEPGIGALSKDFRHFDWLVKGSQRHRACEAFDFGDRLVYATDTPLATNEVVSLDKASGRIDHIARVEGSCIHAARFGGTFAFSTTIEPGAVDRTQESSLWISRDGERWRRAFSARKDRWPAVLQFGTLVLPRGHSPSETIVFSGQAVRGLDGKLAFAQLTPTHGDRMPRK